jgi:hypothetical protein
VLIAVIGAKRARRSPEGRCEARGRPCPHDAVTRGRGRDGFMKDARGRWEDRNQRPAGPRPSEGEPWLLKDPGVAKQGATTGLAAEQEKVAVRHVVRHDRIGS